MNAMQKLISAFRNTSRTKEIVMLDGALSGYAVRFELGIPVFAMCTDGTESESKSLDVADALRAAYFESTGTRAHTRAFEFSEWLVGAECAKAMIS